MKTESEFITRMQFRLAYYRVKFNSKVKNLLKAINSLLGMRPKIHLVAVDE